MLTRFPTVLLQPLGHLSGKLRRFRALPRALALRWRRERDSNPRYPYGYSGFRDRPIQPLSHLSAGENTRIGTAFPPPNRHTPLDFAPFLAYLMSLVPTRQEGFRVLWRSGPVLRSFDPFPASPWCLFRSVPPPTFAPPARIRAKEVSHEIPDRARHDEFVPRTLLGAARRGAVHAPHDGQPDRHHAPAGGRNDARHRDARHESRPERLPADL